MNAQSGTTFSSPAFRALNRKLYHWRYSTAIFARRASTVLVFEIFPFHCPLISCWKIKEDRKLNRHIKCGASNIDPRYSVAMTDSGDQTAPEYAALLPGYQRAAWRKVIMHDLILKLLHTGDFAKLSKQRRPGIPSLGEHFE